MSLPTLLRAMVFYASMAVFLAGAAAFNLLCLACAWLPSTVRTERVFQWLIQRQAALYFRWLAIVGAVRIEYRDWDCIPCARAVIVANHPGLLDAFYILARMPRAFCVFKRSLGRNPTTGAAARRAGYLANDTGLELVRGAAAKLATGSSLVIFPEGTRTRPDAGLGAFRPGFALIARRAGVPVQLVRISADAPLFPKQRPWWKVPQLPARVLVQAGPALDARAFPSTEALVAEVETWFRNASVSRVTLTSTNPAPLTVS